MRPPRGLHGAVCYIFRSGWSPPKFVSCGTSNEHRDVTQHRDALLKGAATRVMSVLDSAKEKDHWLVVKKQASEQSGLMQRSRK